MSSCLVVQHLHKALPQPYGIVCLIKSETNCSAFPEIVTRLHSILVLQRRQQTSKNISRFRCFGRNPVCCFAVAREFLFSYFSIQLLLLFHLCVYETVKLLFKPVVNSNTATSKQYNKLSATSSSMKGSLLQGFVRIYIALFDEKKG